MGQANLKRTKFQARATILSLINSNVQTLDFIGYLVNGDVIDIVDVDGNGNITSTLANNLIVQAINPSTKKIVLDAGVDTALATGTPMIRVQSIDDGQQSIDRLYRREYAGPVGFDLKQNILEARLDTPSVGKATYFVDDVSFFRLGDTVKLIDDNGVVAASAVIDSVNINADAVNNKSSIILTTSIPITLVNNPYIQNLTIDMASAVKRNQERIDQADKPIVNEYLGVGNHSHLAFEFSNIFLQKSSKVFLDDGRKRFGLAGTRASLLQGTVDSALTFESMILGLEGNKTSIEVVAGAGIAVSVSGKSDSGYIISISDNGGLITSKEVADAVNLDVDARRIVQAIYGGNGTGVVAPFGPSSMSGGLDDGTGDYAELEQIWENRIISTGLKWISFHIRPDERNRMNEAPEDDEEVVVDYFKAAVNANR